MRLRTAAAVCACLSVLAACSDTPETAPAPASIPSPSPAAKIWSTVEVSSGCRSAMAKAADETDPDKADPLIVATLSSCRTADEWLLSLEEFPGAMGLTEDAVVGTVDLQSACGTSVTAPACSDGKRKGYV